MIVWLLRVKLFPSASVSVLQTIFSRESLLAHSASASLCAQLTGGAHSITLCFRHSVRGEVYWFKEAIK